MRILFVLLVSTAAMAAPIPPDKQAYIGEWVGPSGSLSIGADGAVAYKQASGSSTKSISGTIVDFVGPNLRIDALVLKVTLAIEPPTEDRGVWVIGVNGSKMIKKTNVTRKQRAENVLRERYRAQKVAIAKVTCPEAMNSTTDGKFPCVIATDLGDSFVVHCKVNAAGDFSWDLNPTVAALDSNTLTAFIAKTHADKFHEPLTATCPPGIILKKAGQVFSCDGKTARRTYKVAVTVKDSAGNIAIDY